MNTKMSLEIGLLRGSGDAAGNDNLPQYLRLPAAVNAPWEVVRDMCAMASESQFFYRSVSTKQWLLTVVSQEGINRFRSNVVPREAYLDSGICLDPHSCRGFSPVREIELNLNRNCRDCALAQQMQDEVTANPQMVDADQMIQNHALLEIEDQVHFLADLVRGVVSKIALRHGTFVKKRFKCKRTFYRELEVALEVSHPNLVHCFGWSWLELDGSDPESDGSDSESDGSDSESDGSDSESDGSDSEWDGSDSEWESGGVILRFYLFMECLEVDLQRFLIENTKKGGTLFSFHNALNVLLHVAEAMAHLHESGFVHGDLKSENVFLSPVELAHTRVPCYLVKVGDFGQTQRVGSSFSTDIGTLEYTAPEIFQCRSRGAPPPQHLQKIDVFSFGVVAFQVLTGAAILYKGLTSGNVRLAVMNGTRPDSEGQGPSLDGRSLSMVSLVRRCWAEDPEERPSFPPSLRWTQRMYSR